MKIIDFKGTEVYSMELKEARVIMANRMEKELAKEHEERKVKRANKIKDLKQLLATVIVAVLLYTTLGYFAVSRMVVIDDLLFFVLMSIILVPAFVFLAVDTAVKIWKR